MIYAHLPKRPRKSLKMDFRFSDPRKLVWVWYHSKWFLKLYNLWSYSDSIFIHRVQNSRNSTFTLNPQGQNFQNFSSEVITSLSKMSLQGTIVPDRLRSELCPWGVKMFLQFCTFILLARSVIQSEQISNSISVVSIWIRTNLELIL